MLRVEVASQRAAAIGSSENPLDLRHEQHQVERVAWRGVELRKVEVEVARCVGLCVDEERSGADSLRRLVGADDRVLHERAAEPVALDGCVDSEPSEKNDRNWAPAGRPQERRRGVIVGDRGCCQGVIGDDPALPWRGHDVDTRRPGRLCNARDVTEPARLRFGAALEGGDVVACGSVEDRPLVANDDGVA